MVNKMTIGEKIKYLRTNIGITGEELANITGINHSLIKKYETNRVVPKQNQIEIIAKALKINPNAILGNNDYVISTVGDFYSLLINLYKSGIINFFQSVPFEENISIELNDKIISIITLYSHTADKSENLNISNLSLILNNKLRQLDSYQTFVKLVNCYNNKSNVEDVDLLELKLQQSTELLNEL